MEELQQAGEIASNKTFRGNQYKMDNTIDSLSKPKTVKDVVALSKIAPIFLKELNSQIIA